MYRRAQNPNTVSGVEDVREAFNNSPTVDRWYKSTAPRSKHKTSKVTPTWRLDEIHGKVTEAGVALTSRGPYITSFSASRHTGNVYFRIKYEHPTFWRKVGP